jgi:hypothetical protein
MPVATHGHAPSEEKRKKIKNRERRGLPHHSLGLPMGFPGSAAVRTPNPTVQTNPTPARPHPHWPRSKSEGAHGAAPEASGREPPPAPRESQPPAPMASRHPRRCPLNFPHIRCLELLRTPALLLPLGRPRQQPCRRLLACLCHKRTNACFICNLFLQHSRQSLV